MKSSEILLWAVKLLAVFLMTAIPAYVYGPGLLDTLGLGAILAFVWIISSYEPLGWGLQLAIRADASIFVVGALMGLDMDALGAYILLGDCVAAVAFLALCLTCSLIVISNPKRLREVRKDLARDRN